MLNLERDLYVARVSRSKLFNQSFVDGKSYKMFADILAIILWSKLLDMIINDRLNTCQVQLDTRHDSRVLMSLCSQIICTFL